MTIEDLKQFLIEKINKSGKVDGLPYALKVCYTKELHYLLEYTSYLSNECKSTERIYHIIYNFPNSKCDCGEHLKFRSFGKGYFKSCGSKGCQSILMSKGRTGKTHSEDTRNKLKEINRIYWSDQENVEKHRIIMVELNKDETRNKKISEKLKGRPKSEDTKRKISETHKKSGKAKKPWAENFEFMYENVTKKGHAACGTREAKEKKKQTNMERYGVENTFQLSKSVEKQKKRYKEDNVNIQKKKETTNLIRYGVKNPFLTYPGYSKVSQELFDTINSIQPRNYQYATLNNEYALQDRGRFYMYDFVDLDSKRIIEFNGDFWHANPKKYNKTDYINVSKKGRLLVEDIWKQDEEKLNFARQNGFEILVVWESDYYDNKESIINKCVNFLND